MHACTSTSIAFWLIRVVLIGLIIAEQVLWVGWLVVENIDCLFLLNAWAKSRFQNKMLRSSKRGEYSVVHVLWVLYTQIVVYTDSRQWHDYDDPDVVYASPFWYALGCYWFKRVIILYLLSKVVSVSLTNVTHSKFFQHQQNTGDINLIPLWRQWVKSGINRSDIEHKHTARTCMHWLSHCRRGCMAGMTVCPWLIVASLVHPRLAVSSRCKRFP